MAEENRNSGGTVGGGKQSRADRNRAESAAQAAKMRSRNHEIQRGVRGDTDEFEPQIHHGDRAGKHASAVNGKGWAPANLDGNRHPQGDTPNHDSIQRGRPVRDTPNPAGPRDDLIGLWNSGHPAQDTPNHDSVQRGRPIRDTPNPSSPLDDLLGLWQTGNPAEDTPNYDSVQRGRPIRDTPNPESPLAGLIGLWDSGRPEQDTPNPGLAALFKALSTLGQSGHPAVDTPNPAIEQPAVDLEGNNSPLWAAVQELLGRSR